MCIPLAERVLMPAPFFCVANQPTNSASRISGLTTGLSLQSFKSAHVCLTTCLSEIWWFLFHQILSEIIPSGETEIRFVDWLGVLILHPHHPLSPNGVLCGIGAFPTPLHEVGVQTQGLAFLQKRFFSAREGGFGFRWLRVYVCLDVLSPSQPRSPRMIVRGSLKVIGPPPLGGGGSSRPAAEKLASQLGPPFGLILTSTLAQKKFVPDTIKSEKVNCKGKGKGKGKNVINGKSWTVHQKIAFIKVQIKSFTCRNDFFPLSSSKQIWPSLQLAKHT